MDSIPLEAALQYAAMGYPVFPCRFDKAPATAHGWKDAVTDPEQIRKWWNENPAYNVGLSSANLSKIEVCAEIKKQLPAFVYLEAAVGEDPDKRDYIVSNEKIEKTGFKPKYGLTDGITELIKGYTILRITRYGNV